MKLIFTNRPGVLDYAISIILIAAPWALGFARNGAETWVPVLSGLLTIIYTQFINQRPASISHSSINARFIFDFLSGSFLAVTPWIFNFSGYVYLPHLILGLLEMGIALLSRQVPRQLNNLHVRIPYWSRPAH